MFQGYLIKIGNYNFPLNKMKWDSYKATPQTRQDIDSYRDANGILHRVVLDHTLTKLEFETTPMPERDWIDIMNNINSNLTNSLEKQCTLFYYNPLTGGYNSGTFYIPDIVPTFNIPDGKVEFLPTRIAFIEY